MKDAWNQFLTAVMLLTRLPVGRWCHYSPNAVTASVAYFPAVGALVGLVCAGVLTTAADAFPAKLAVLLSMLAGVLVTGAFHEDGLADAADGIFGGRTPFQRMEIMKDSRLGSFGAIALWFALSAKFVLLEAILAKSLLFVIQAIVCAHVASRAAAVAVMQLQPHVGLDTTRSHPFCRTLSRVQVWCALAPPAVLMVFCFETAAIPVLACVTLLVFFLANFFHKKIGGITGDCLGATVQISELTVLTALLSRS